MYLPFAKMDSRVMVTTYNRWKLLVSVPEDPSMLDSLEMIMATFEHYLHFVIYWMYKLGIIELTQASGLSQYLLSMPNR